MTIRTGMLAMAVFAALHCAGQNISVPRSMLDSIANPPVADLPQFAFERLTADVGGLSDSDEPADFVFPFRNTGNEPLVITQVNTSCGCIMATYPKKPVAAGGQGEVVLTYNPYQQAGTVYRKVFVYTNASTRPSAQLTLTGTVLAEENGEWADYPIMMGALRVKCKGVSFVGVSAGNKYTERIECVNSGVQTLRVSGKESPAYKWLTVKSVPEALEPGQKGELVITVDGSRMPEQSETKEMVLLEGIQARPSQRTLIIMVTRN